MKQVCPPSDFSVGCTLIATKFSGTHLLDGTAGASPCNYESWNDQNLKLIKEYYYIIFCGSCQILDHRALLNVHLCQYPCPNYKKYLDHNNTI